MKKITLITAAIAALAAATVAAQTGDHTTGSNESDMVVASLQVQEAPLRRTTRTITQKQSGTGIDQIRYVIGPRKPGESCEQAAWPYYPVDCLQRVEQSGL
ncbi:hypothetical protein [Hoeflea sp. IMCC20628]|uniref:hypothetical protein n=1 Tax=Hoeflea sp. IMCC20628 TaxID=1620421 RepID=UPI00063A882F|nr:hypothetical protein [Hoeflea sp. IMCC20628]